MITDSYQIEEAISGLLKEDFFIPLSRADFEKFCPGPTTAMHFVADSADDAATILSQDLAQTPALFPDIVMAVKSETLTVAELETLGKALPQTQRLKRGLIKGKPEGGMIEVWLFAAC